MAGTFSVPISAAELAARNKAVAQANTRAGALDIVVETMARRLADDKPPPDLRVAQDAIRRAETRQEWAAWHREQARRHRATLTDLICHHEREAARLE
jgi:enoyl-CoA hydratase/carnithine racemase